MEQENRIYLLTGAAGFLGSHICEELLEKGEKVRALVLPGDCSAKYIPEEVELVEGNLCDREAMEKFFDVIPGTETICIHCASIVTVNPEFSQKLLDVNVGGTENIIELCLTHTECKKLVYVSSTGAIPELPKGEVIKEVTSFQAEDDRVVGWYSKSKAIATQKVLDAVHKKGLNACVVHPSGILGPKDFAIGEVTGTVIKIINGELPVGMSGSFNLCDVRDLAEGCIMAAEHGRKGECYILGNEEVTLKKLCSILERECHCKGPKLYLPAGLSYKLADIMEKRARKAGKKSVMTRFSVYNLNRNNQFDFSKAEQELGYHTRPYAETLHDMVQWLKVEHKIKFA